MRRIVNVFETVVMMTQVEVEVADDATANEIEQKAFEMARDDDNYPQNETGTLGGWSIIDCVSERTELEES